MEREVSQSQREVGAYAKNRKLLSESNALKMDGPGKMATRQRKRKKLSNTVFQFPKPYHKKRKKHKRPRDLQAKDEAQDLDLLPEQLGQPHKQILHGHNINNVIDLTLEEDSESESHPPEVSRNSSNDGTIVGSGESATRSDESATSSDEPAASSDEPATSSDDELANSDVQLLNKQSSDDLFHGDVELPILSRQNRVRTSALHAVRAILDTQKKSVCSKHPTQIDINCSFVLDTEKLQDPEDAKCDDCGAWKQTKTATSYLTISFCDDGSVDYVENCSGINRKNDCIYTLVRRHYTCKSSPDLSRHISVLFDPSGYPKSNQLIQYRFSGKQHSVDVKPHGNSKQGARAYKRTCPSTIKDLEQEVKLHPPKRAVYKVDQKRGGILNVTCAGDLPRNAMQASRIRCKKTLQQSPLTYSSDPMQDLVEEEQIGQPEQFVQSIRLVPHPIIVLFNKSQLDDLQQFCATSEKASVLGIDVTFNLGKFYVTVCAFQNFRVINEHGKHPVMIGPTLIHSSKDQSNFDILFQEITNKKPSLATSLRAYGTDGEQALSAAAANAFPFATHLQCANHLKDNIMAHLHKQLLPESVIKEILNDIFWYC